MSKIATIMCVRTADVEKIQFGATAQLDLPLMDIPSVWAGPRQHLETDPTFLQIIPYILIKRGNEYLSYVRTTAGGEDRLHGKVSIGLGGHIDAEDFRLNDDGAIDFERTVGTGAARELIEELNMFTLRSDLVDLGFVRWDASEVDKVHLGVVLLLDLDRFPRYDATTLEVLKAGREDAVGDLRFMSPEELRSTDLELETWTRLALDLI